MSQLSVQQQTSAAFSPLTDTLPEPRPDATREGIRKIVEQAPVPLAQQLDRVQPHVVEPEQTLPPETLNERNHETALTAASRALEQTLAQGEDEAIETALENVELARGEAPGDPTPEMALLIRTAQQRQAPDAQGVPQRDAGVPAEGGPGLEAGRPAAANGPEIAGAQPVVMEDTGEIMEIGGQQVRMEDMPEEVFAALLDYAPGVLHVREEGASLESLRALSERLGKMSDKLGGDDRPVATVAATRLLERQVQVDNTAASMEHLQARLAQLADACGRPGESPKAELDALMETFRPVWEISQLQTRALDGLNSDDPAVRQQAHTAFDQGISILGADADAFQTALADALAGKLEAALTAAGKGGLSREALGNIALLSLRAGVGPSEAADAVSAGLTWASGDGMKTALTEAFAQGVADTLRGDAAEPRLGERMRYVDMLFQGAYPEASDAALALKKLLSPGHDQAVETQHECLMATRQLLSDILDSPSAHDFSRTVKPDGAVGSPSTRDLSRTAGLRNAVGSASARSFMLTPDLVKSLQGKVKIPDFNYHLAHVALLQKHAAEMGLLPVDEATRQAIGDTQKWCESLNLGKDAAKYAGELAAALHGEPDDADQTLERLRGACAQFVRGFRGETEVSKAGAIVLKRAGMTGHLTSARYEEAIYKSSPQYLARLVLDKHIVNLTGLIKAEDRFLNGRTGLALNGAGVDAAMRSNIGRLMADGNWAGQALYGGIRDLDEAMQDQAGAMRTFRHHLRTFQFNADMVNTFGKEAGEAIELLSGNAEARKQLKAEEQGKSLLRFAWPHQKAERRAVRDTVLEIGRLTEAIEDLGDPPSDAEALERLSGQREAKLNELRGVDASKLLHDRKAGNAVPDLDAVLEHMLPRARGLAFFESKTADGGKKTEARHTLDQIKASHAKFRAHEKEINKYFSAVSTLSGKDDLRRMQQTVVAGLLKAFVESQEPPAAFNTGSEATRKRIMDQLKTWGMDPEHGLTAVLVDVTLANMCNGDGTLNLKRLQREAKDVRLDFTGKEEVTKKIQEEHGELSRVSAHFKTRKFVNEKLLPDERRRSEGIHELMQGASTPGSGFAYDRARGIVGDTGAIFTPVGGNPLVSLISTAHPLSIRFKLMHDDSITVTNVGQNSFQVLLKGSVAASVGAGMKFALPAKFTATAGGDIGGDRESGMALTFGSQRDCEAFLEAFMRPSSGLHKKSKEENDPSVWMKATQIRFVDGRSVSGDVSVGLMHSLFTQKIPQVGALSVSGAASFAMSGEVRQRVERNVHGETILFSRKGRLTGALAASTGVAHGKAVANIKPAAGAHVLSIDGEQRFKIIMGEQGVMPGTCMETEFSRGTSKPDAWLNMVLPKAVKRHAGRDVTFFTSLRKMLADVPPSARLSIRWDLKPGMLDQVRQRFAQARMAPDKALRDKLLDEAHSLLANPSSYSPASISVRTTTPSKIARNWSPGLGPIQYARNTSFARFSSRPALEITFPHEADTLEEAV